MYNSAQTNEKALFIRLLDELAFSAKEPRNTSEGRPSLSLHDKIFSMCLAIYVGKSSRQATSELELAKKLGFIEQKPHFNNLLNYFRGEKLTPVLHRLLTLSALPLKRVEENFTVDSTSFSISEFARWYDYKWRRKTGKTRQWAKAHVVSGVKTNVITVIEITKGNVADVTQFEVLVKKMKLKIMRKKEKEKRKRKWKNKPGKKRTIIKHDKCEYTHERTQRLTDKDWC